MKIKVHTNYNCCSWYSRRKIITGTRGWGNKRTSWDHLNYNIFEIGQNTEKSPGDMVRLAVTQSLLKDHQLTQMGKTSANERHDPKRIPQENAKTTRDKTLQQKPHQRKKTWAVTLVRYSGPFLKWTREELKQMDQRTRKLMTMHKALHPRDDVDRLYVSRKEGERGLASIEDTVEESIQRLEDYIEKHKRGLVTTIRVDTDNTINERMTTRKQK